MPASGFKSKGGGTIFLVFLLLLGVAGASAFFIHKVLTAEDAPVAATGQPGSSRTGEDLGPPVVLQPDGSPNDTTGSSGDLPQGQFVVPPTQVPQTTPEGTGTASGQVTNPNGQFPETLPGDPSLAATGEPDVSGSLSADPAPNLLLVPGAIEPTLPTAQEDAVVRPAFVNDIAVFLAQNYWPQNTHPSARRGGITTASLQWANLRYGAELRSLDGRGGDSHGARRAILGYVLNPAVIGRIYGLYSDGFVAALRQEADKRLVGEENGKRSLSITEKKEMFTIYSGFSARLADALENYAADPTMPDKVQAYAQAEQAVQEANRMYLESMLVHEEAATGDDKARITAAQLRMDKEAATYQKRIREREAAKNSLVNGMSKGQRGRNEADTLVYTAFWAHRRGKDSTQALQACAKALNDMSAKLAASSRRME